MEGWKKGRVEELEERESLSGLIFDFSPSLSQTCFTINAVGTAKVWYVWSRNKNVIYMNEHSLKRTKSHGAWARRFIFILCYQSVVEMKLKIISIYHDFD